jgi:hypothetical protein
LTSPPKYVCPKLIGPSRHVETNDQAISFNERVTCNRSFDLVPSEQLERQPEFIDQLLLPLLNEAARRDYQAPFKITPDQQLFDQEPGHDCLASTGIVGEQKS